MPVVLPLRSHLSPVFRGVCAGASRCASTAVDRRGVFFNVDQLPTTGKPANRRSEPAQLQKTVESWRRPWSPGPLTPQQLDQYFSEGWVIVDKILPKQVMEDAIRSVEHLVDDVAQTLYSKGKIHDMCKDASFEHRLIRLEEQFKHANVLLHKKGVLPSGIQQVWGHPQLMAIASQILGSESDIMGHPVWNLRCKTPENLSMGQATVPWHQDNAYLDEECWDKLQVTAWVPLVDTNLHNGCMQVVRGAHLSGITANHACCVGGTWYTEVTPEELEATLGCDISKDIVTCEVPLGSVLLLNNLIPHRSMENNSDGVRWSLDLRWQRGGEPNGFNKVKDSVLMKPAGDFAEWNGTVDWGDWANVERTALQEKALSDTERDAIKEAGQAEDRYDEDPELDTTIAGPWMTNWNLIHHNRHTAKLQAA
eukprot:gnl/MRDRNA2_/MRDRNA2_97624_c0_seq1.p1 gnl/MRDRNA2_/MRDRNA2_97624_c0~~gnl/MRDRNA2_/MRDRNA2_97624_c0_seq1.p1  ORF type:complete len:423 (+),score=74.57 gnl/MRDRNA2_/MRDRNA2_97624_c0_seq1:96-1364(+)